MTRIFDWAFSKLLTVERATDLILNWINKLLKKVKYEQIAGVIEKVAEAIKAGLSFVKSESLRDALVNTADVVHLVAVAVRDRVVTVDESTEVIDAVEEMVKAWRAVTDHDEKGE